MRTAYSVQRRTASVGLLFMIRLSCPLLASPPTSTHITNHSPQKRLFQRRCLLPWRKFKLLEHIQVSLEMTYFGDVRRSAGPNHIGSGADQRVTARITNFAR
jgi:hypothetical protein